MKLLGRNEKIVEYLAEHGGEDGMEDGRTEQEGNPSIDGESALYRYLLKYHTMPRFTPYKCTECGAFLMDHLI